MYKNAIIVVLVAIIVVLAFVFLKTTKPKPTQVVSVQNYPTESNELKNDPYILNKEYSYTYTAGEEQKEVTAKAVFLGIEQDKSTGAFGLPKFALYDSVSNGQTAYFYGNFEVRLKDSSLLKQLTELNAKYGIVFDDAKPQGYGPGNTVYVIKLQSNQNLFEIFDIYHKSGLFVWISPDFNSPGLGL